MVDPRDHAATASFLHHEFASQKFADVRYLNWFYDNSPNGAAINGTEDDDHGRLANYSLVPQRWRNGTTTAQLGITVDACVRAGAQRGGVFSGLAERVFAESFEVGIEGTLTIANANSTPAFVNKLGFSKLNSLPVVLIPAFRLTLGVAHVDIDDVSIDALASDCAKRTSVGWIHDWDAAALRWRLASPANDYVLHRDNDVWCVSTRSTFARWPIAVILALVPREGRRALSAAAVIARACRHHRAPLAIHAGINSDVIVRGLPIPRPFLPSPLNLLVRGFGSRTNASLTDVGTYEFLDTDHF